MQPYVSIAELFRREVKRALLGQQAVMSKAKVVLGLQLLSSTSLLVRCSSHFGIQNQPRSRHLGGLESLPFMGIRRAYLEAVYSMLGPQGYDYHHITCDSTRHAS